MSNDFFRFKQFNVRHDRCAMKVGTDGVLLGAWGSVEGCRILDIGTGTGLIAMMAAQRNPRAVVLGIDIDGEAVGQALQNVAESPFSERVSCLEADVLTFRSALPFDAILCNPPFFTEDTLPADKGRALARNSMSLPFASLVRKVCTLLSADGCFSVIVPAQTATDFVGLCLAEGLHLRRRCTVQTTARKQPRRALLCFSKQQTACCEEQLILMNPDGSRSEQYKLITEDFYLDEVKSQELRVKKVGTSRKM